MHKLIVELNVEVLNIERLFLNSPNIDEVELDSPNTPFYYPIFTLYNPRNVERKAVYSSQLDGFNLHLATIAGVEDILFLNDGKKAQTLINPLGCAITRLKVHSDDYERLGFVIQVESLIDYLQSLKKNCLKWPYSVIDVSCEGQACEAEEENQDSDLLNQD